MFKGYTTPTGSQLKGGPWKPSTYNKYPILKSFAGAEKPDMYSYDDSLDTANNEVLVVVDPTYTNARGHAFTDPESYNTAMQVFKAYVDLDDNNIPVLVNIPEETSIMPDSVEGLDKPTPEWRLDDMVQPVDHVVSQSL